MNISEPFIRRPVATSLLMAGVILLGILGYKLLPISALPTVDFPTVEVTTYYPGASADVMVSSITTPLERQFGQIAGLASMNSTSSFGTSTITLQFVLDRPIDVAAQDVQAAINVAGGFLPKDLPNPPRYNKVNPADTPILTLAITSDSLPLDRVNDFADTLLAQKLSEVTGVGLGHNPGQPKAGRARAGESGSDFSARAEPRRCAHDSWSGERKRAERKLRRTATIVHHRVERSDFFCRGLQANHRCLQERRADSARRRCEHHRQRGERPAGGVGRHEEWRKARGAARHSASARREHHSNRRARESNCCRD